MMKSVIISFIGRLSLSVKLAFYVDELKMICLDKRKLFLILMLVKIYVIYSYNLVKNKISLSLIS